MSKSNASRRGRNLTDEDVLRVVEVLDGWDGELSWNELIARVERVLHWGYTRQTLSKHERIRAAFQLTKRRVSETPLKPAAERSNPLLDRLARMSAENGRLKQENSRLLEQFVRWAYNARARGIAQDLLDSPLPKANRRQTKL